MPQRLEMGSNVTNAILLSLANFVGNVVGSINPPRRKCGASYLPPRYPLKPKGV
jgi:hypothetical protein